MPVDLLRGHPAFVFVAVLLFYIVSVFGFEHSPNFACQSH